MFMSLAFHGLRLIVLCSVFFCVQAFAQFEVSPDHFESPAPQHAAKKKMQAQPAQATHLVQPTPALAAAGTAPHQQSSGQSASRVAERRPRRKLQPALKQSQVVAARRKRSDEKQNVAVSP